MFTGALPEQRVAGQPSHPKISKRPRLPTPETGFRHFKAKHQSPRRRDLDDSKGELEGGNPGRPHTGGYAQAF